MGILSDIFGYEPSPAFEADDITERVAQQMRGGTGPNEVDNATGADRERTEDLTQTDNIYEEATSPDNGNDNQNNQGDQQDNGGGGDDQGDNPLERDDGQQDEGDSGSDDSSDSGDEEENPPSSVFSDKNTLKDNAINLINILSTNITALTTTLGNFDDFVDIKCCNSVISNLTRTKELLIRMVTTEMKKKSYEELMTTYVTAKRIYDVSIEMLNKHFIKDKKGKSPLKSSASTNKG